MIRTLLGLVLVFVLVVAAFAFFTGYRFGDVRQPVPAEGTVGTTGVVHDDADRTDRRVVDREDVRQGAAEIEQRAGDAVDQASAALSDASLTAKIKSKMALDDMVKALNIDVDTQGGVVTLSGLVHSAAERERAVQLARETAGVRQVVDALRTP